MVTGIGLSAVYDKEIDTSIWRIKNKLDKTLYIVKMRGEWETSGIVKSRKAQWHERICIILHYNMYYFHFTLQEPSLTYLSFSRSFSMPCASFSMHIIHIIVQNNTYYSARSRWTKQQHEQVIHFDIVFLLFFK